MSEPDYYDRAVAYLTQRPEEIIGAWQMPSAHPAGGLFAFVEPGGGRAHTECGCLTQIRDLDEVACTEELTQAIRADERIPVSARRIGACDLPVFAEWQRRIDRALNRTPPVWREPEAT